MDDPAYLPLIQFDHVAPLTGCEIISGNEILSDVAEISINNMLNLRWLWSYKWYLAGVILRRSFATRILMEREEALNANKPTWEGTANHRPIPLSHVLLTTACVEEWERRTDGVEAHEQLLSQVSHQADSYLNTADPVLRSCHRTLCSRNHIGLSFAGSLRRS